VVNHFVLPFGIHARTPPAFPVSRAKLPRGVSCVHPLFRALFSRVLPASRPLLCARFRTCRQASAVTRWAASFGGCTAAATTRSSAASTCLPRCLGEVRAPCGALRPRAWRHRLCGLGRLWWRGPRPCIILEHFKTKWSLTQDPLMLMSEFFSVSGLFLGQGPFFVLATEPASRKADM
jgi:hypothetical protein